MACHRLSCCRGSILLFVLGISAVMAMLSAVLFRALERQVAAVHQVRQTERFEQSAVERLNRKLLLEETLPKSAMVRLDAIEETGTNPFGQPLTIEYLLRRKYLGSDRPRLPDWTRLIGKLGQSTTRCAEPRVGPFELGAASLTCRHETMSLDESRLFEGNVETHNARIGGSRNGTFLVALGKISIEKLSVGAAPGAAASIVIAAGSIQIGAVNGDPGAELLIVSALGSIDLRDLGGMLDCKSSPSVRIEAEMGVSANGRPLGAVAGCPVGRGDASWPFFRVVGRRKF
ncbi:MAG: hypothetical protein U0136_11740 [Bdellovibrionota bacterium]